MAAPPPPVRSVTTREKAIYSAGGGVQQFANTSTQYLANPIFNLELGMNPAFIGIVLGIGRLWDSFIDPLIGHLSDNTRSRWGRRRPYMLAGAVLMGASFAAMWWLPRDAGDSFYFGYFLFTVLSFFLGVSLFEVPWNALGIEMTKDYNERTSLFASAGITRNLVGFTTGWLYPFTQLAAFQDVLQGAKVLGCICGSILIGVCVFTALRLKEPPPAETPVPSRPREREPFFKALKIVVSNRVLLVFSLAGLATGTSLYTVSSLGLYINIYHIFDGDKVAAATMMGIWGTTFNAVAMLSIPVIMWLSHRVEKHRMIMIGLGMVFVSAMLKYVLYTPDAPYLQMATALLQAPGMTAFLIMVSSMTADIVDYDEFISGRRREALIGAASAWIAKAGASLSFVFAGLVLNWTNFDATLPTQAPGTIFGMRVLFCAIPVAGTGIGLILLSRYPLSKSRVSDIQAELSLRRARHALSPT